MSARFCARAPRLKYKSADPSSAFCKYIGACSAAAVFTPGPSGTGSSQAKSSLGSARCDTKMSVAPPPLLLAKKSRWPSRDRLGAKSAPAVLIGGPRCTGACQAHARSSGSVQARCDTQMSSGPDPPGRFEEKQRLRPSRASVAFCSLEDELTTGPRFTGSDHSEPANDMASSLGAAGWDCHSHARSSAREASGTRVAMATVLMGSPL